MNLAISQITLEITAYHFSSHDTECKIIQGLGWLLYFEFFYGLLNNFGFQFIWFLSLCHTLEFSFPAVELVSHILTKSLLCLRKLLNYLHSKINQKWWLWHQDENDSWWWKVKISSFKLSIICWCIKFIVKQDNWGGVHFISYHLYHIMPHHHTCSGFSPWEAVATGISVSHSFLAKFVMQLFVFLMECWEKIC